jgi:hypothetical protein
MAAVGSAVKSGAGIAFMEQMAAADARVNLARGMRASVLNKIKADETLPEMDKTDQDSAMISKISNDSLQGTRIEKSAFGPNGTLYVLVGLDETSANKLVETISADYLKQKRK